jgi:predicted aldo/keto reductase-like oxidoreductase
MTSPAEVEENVAAGETGGVLTQTEKRLVELIRDRTTALAEKFCTSCGYCQPCPNEVNVPGIFRLWNLLRGYGAADYAKLEYQKLREQRHWADFPGASAEECTECGECEEKCPEKLPVVEDLKRAHADLTRDWHG